jgi:hypothetical protein
MWFGVLAGAYTILEWLFRGRRAAQAARRAAKLDAKAARKQAQAAESKRWDDAYREATTQRDRKAAPAAAVSPATRAPTPAETIATLHREAAERDQTIATLRKQAATAAIEADAMEGRLRGLEATVGAQAARIRTLERDMKGTDAAPSGGTGDAAGQFRRLRALLVKELHPDHAVAGSVDGAIRAEVFKTLWPKIEAIAGRV